MLLRGDCARARVVACDSREAAGKKIGLDKVGHAYVTATVIDNN